MSALTAFSQRIVAETLRRRKAFPHWLNRTIDAIADNPTGLVGAVAARLLWRFDPEDVPAPMRAPEGEPAVYIGPVNYSQQGYAWSRALQAQGIDAVNSAVHVPGGYTFQADRVIPLAVFESSHDWREAEFDAVSAYSHVLIEAEKPLFSRLFDRDVSRETVALSKRGVSVAFMAHGTDARLPSRHASSSPWSPFRDEGVYFDRVEREAERNIALLTRLGRPTFASTPDLLDDLPFAHWCPVVVDPEQWSVPRPQYEGPLRVVHAPTNPQLKGTDLIEPLLERLDAEGVISYRRIVHVPHAEMPEVFATADVMLDQFRLGSFGVAACEAMAGGAVTIAHVTQQVQDRVRAASGLELPIIDATPDTLEGVLRALAKDRSEIARLSELSQHYVREVHDGRFSAQVLSEHWINAEHRESEQADVDVVIAAHDPQRAIDRAVGSVIRSRRARAIVVAHNTEVDAVRGRLGAWAEHPRVRVLELRDDIPSPAGPFNAGLDVATAEWVAVLGSDDELESGALDSWLEMALRDRADAVIAQVRDADTGALLSVTPVRPRRRAPLDPVRDRLAYRAAPLGLIRRAALGDQRFTPELASGEDIALSTALWFAKGHRVLLGDGAPAYLVHADAPTRVTGTQRSVEDDMGFLPALNEVVERLGLSAAQRRALATKLLRVNVFALVTNRDHEFWIADTRKQLADACRKVLAIADDDLRALSRAEQALVDAILAPQSATSELYVLAARRVDRRSPSALLTANLRYLFANDAPIRFGIAAALLGRHSRRRGGHA